MRELKESRYNHFFPIEDGKILAINCLSGSMVVFTPELWKQYEKLTAKSFFREPKGELKHLVQELRRGKFLLDDDFDELSYLKVTYRRKQFDNTALALTILPTLNCNFRCIYCYEQKEKTYMTREIEDLVSGLVVANIGAKELLSVTWYGGEPLLTRKTIARLSESFCKLCEASKCSYEAQMVTNGYLLTREVGLQLREYQVKTVQVTLDGPPKFHNSRRMLVSGGETFSTIINNMLECADLFHLIVRVNIDRDNASHAVELLDYLCEIGLKEKVYLYFAPTFDPSITRAWGGSGKGCLDLMESYSETYFTNPHFSQIEVPLSEEALKRGFPLRNFMNFSSQCSAVSPSGLVIEPSGALQKCWHTVGDPSQAIGHVSEKVTLDAKTLRWLSFEPFSDHRCRNCDILPLCMGGCPHRAICGAPFSFRCTPLKHNIVQMARLLRAYEALKKTEET